MNIKSTLIAALSICLLFITQTACSDTSKSAQNQTKILEEVDYYELLKQEIKTAEASADRDPSKFAYLACNILREKANGDLKQLKQAYLWCVVGDKEKGITTTQFPLRGYGIDNMHKNGDLKLVDPKLDAIWEDKKQRVYYLKHIALPDLLLEVRNELAKTELPVFSAHFADQFGMSEVALIEVYDDGRVKLITNGNYVKKQLSTSAQTVKNFMSDLKKLGFNQWEQPAWDLMVDSECEFDCQPTTLKITIRYGADIHRLFYATLYNVFDRKQPLSNYENRIRMAKIRALILKHFLVGEIHCTIGQNKELRVACIQRETAWENLAKEMK
jgi:hypothetical protein